MEATIFNRSRDTINKHKNVRPSQNVVIISEWNEPCTSRCRCVIEMYLYARIACSRHALSVSHNKNNRFSTTRVYNSSCWMLSSRFRPKKKKQFLRKRDTYGVQIMSRQCTQHILYYMLPIIVMTRALLSLMENVF